MQLFDNISDASLELEIADVQKKEYKIFDSRGLVLAPVIADDGMHVRLTEPSEPLSRAGELEVELRNFLNSLGDDRTSLSKDDVQRMALPELIEQLSTFQKRARERRGFWFWRRK